MFREMRRYKQAVTAETCAEILKTEKRGVLSVIGDDELIEVTPESIRMRKAILSNTERMKKLKGK